MKYLLYLIFPFVALVSYAQETYMVYNATEGAQLVHNKSVTPLVRRQALHANDTVRLEKNARLDIVVTNTARQIITCQQEGTATVYAMLRAARNKANDVSRLTTQNISQTVGNKPTTASVVYGTTMRGQAAETIAFHAQLAEAVCNAILDICENKYKPSKIWAVEKVFPSVSDSLFCFAVQNSGKKNLYFNIVAFTFLENQQIMFDLLYQPSFMQDIARSWGVMPGERLILSTYVYDRIPGVYYLAFSTETPFDEEAFSFQLKTLLQMPITSMKRMKTPMKVYTALLKE